jgi:hypothetical protein
MENKLFAFVMAFRDVPVTALTSRAGRATVRLGRECLRLRCMGAWQTGSIGRGVFMDMVSSQIEARGVRMPSVLAAMRQVPRHCFVPEACREAAYDDTPLPIGHGQTISQPYIVGLMTELIRPEPDFTVLEIGAGSGYQAAVLAAAGDGRSTPSRSSRRWRRPRGSACGRPAIGTSR